MRSLRHEWFSLEELEQPKERGEREGWEQLLRRRLDGAADEEPAPPPASDDEAPTASEAETAAEVPDVSPSDGARQEPVRLEAGPDLCGHVAYTVALDFCKERESDSGYLLSFDGSFSVFLEADRLEASVTTSFGETALLVEGAGLGAGAWHRLTLAFSGESGRIDLSLNGERVASATGLEGARQVGDPSSDLFLGCPAGRSFTGRIDNFSFLDRAL